MMNLKILADRYEVKQQLGKKAGRRTFSATDLLTGKSVIVKLLAFSNDFEWDDLKLFEREAQTLKSLSHPQIPLYLDYFEVNSSTYKGFALVQTYISAQTIEQYLQAGRKFTEIEVKEIAKAVLEILKYLHELNPPVVHRDIKPSNILLGERSGNSVGSVYLIDFGSVQTVLAAEGGTRTIVGTYGYMPQEQFGGRTVPASDLYSLGATLIYLVTGTNPADLPQKDFRIQFQQFANLSPSFANWLQRITEPSLEKRFSTATQALRALQQPQYTNTSALTVEKPVGSKIQLTKNEDTLDIIIPPLGFQFIMVFWLVYLITIWLPSSLAIGMCLFKSISVVPLGVYLFVALFALFWWGSGFLTISGILYDLFASERIHIDQQQMTRDYYFRNRKSFTRYSSSRERERRLFYKPQHLTVPSGQNGSILIPANFVIWAGVEKFEFKIDKSIKSEAELEWLARELSDYLKIEITGPFNYSDSRGKSSCLD